MTSPTSPADITQLQAAAESGALGIPSAEATAARFPAVLLLHDWHGVDAAITEAARRLQECGYVTYVPDLFANSAPPPGADDAALAAWTQGLADSSISAEMVAAIDRLCAHQLVDAARLGVVGWGWGGAHALIGTAHDSRIGAAASIGGDISYAATTPKRPGSPLNFVASLHGAFFAAYPDGDPLFPQIEVDRLSARLREHDKTGEVKIFAGTPARFWQQPELPQTAALWRRLEEFLANHLKPHSAAQLRTAAILAHEAGHPSAV